MTSKKIYISDIQMGRTLNGQVVAPCPVCRKKALSPPASNPRTWAHVIQADIVTANGLRKLSNFRVISFCESVIDVVPRVPVLPPMRAR